MGKKLSIEEMKLIAKERDGECLSDVYINQDNKLLWKCSKGHTWEASSGAVKRGTWCPICSHNIKLTIQEMQDLAKEKGGQWCPRCAKIKKNKNFN
ncbi:MAG: hypothetical protein KGH55_01715 [Nanoarchaeota archaeon]|nr:hypothetical protein [Nanoarchaeota archaeon]